MKEKTRNKLTLFILLAGVLILAGAAGLYVKNYLEQQGGIKTNGVIIGFEERYHPDSSARNPEITYHPMIEYYIESGERMIAYESDRFDRSEFFLGDTVKVTCNRGNPEKATIISYSWIFDTPFILALTGILLILLSRITRYVF